MEFVIYFYSLVLGFIFVPLLSVKCGTLPKTYTSYRPSPFCNPSDYMRYPKSSDDVVAIVKEAIRRGVKVKAFGARHSQTDIICTEGIPVDMTKLAFSKMNPDNTATFGAGITVKAAGQFLLKHGQAFRVTPAYGSITLGGAIGTGAHGSSIRYNSTLSAQVIKMTVVNGLGEKVVISDPDDLKAFRIHLGLLGIVSEVTMYTVPIYKILAHNYVKSDKVLTDGRAIQWARTTDQINFYWYPALEQVVVANLTFVPASTRGEAKTNAIAPPTYASFNLIGSKVKEIAYDLTSSECALASELGNTVMHVLELITQSSLYKQTPALVPIYTEDGISVKNPAVGYPDSMLATVCSEEESGLLREACFFAHGESGSNITILDNEIAIPLSKLKAFITDAKDIVSKTPTLFPILGVWIRFSGKSDVYMSTSYQRDTAHIEFSFWKRTDFYNEATGSLAGYQTILQTLAKKYGGRAHWGKAGSVYHSSEMLDLKLDSQARQNFVAAMNKFDPNKIFLNNFGRRITKTGNKIDNDPLITRCALLDNCFCKKDSDCAKSQSCTFIPGYKNYTVCKTRNEAAEFDKSILPLDGLINWVVMVVPNLVTDTLAKCPLDDVLLNTVPDVLSSLV